MTSNDHQENDVILLMHLWCTPKEKLFYPKLPHDLSVTSSFFFFSVWSNDADIGDC